ncbi:MAG: translation elongation factor Ts [Patescibacteria group bacterium]
MDNSLVVKLRQMTGAGIVDCKNALEEVGGDLEKAAEALRKKGIAKASKREERETREGVVATYIHSNNKMGVMVELLSETDFVARNEDFKKLASDIAMHIAALNPLYLSPESVPQEVVQKEREIYTQEFAGSGKPQNIIDNIVNGKLQKFFEETCLTKQKFIKDEEMTIDDLVKQKIGVIGENIKIGRFARFEI